MQPDFMYAAVANGNVDVIAGYTSEGRIKEYDLVTLADPEHAIPPYDAVLLLAPRRAYDAALQEALKPLLGRIDIPTMREANLRASGSNASFFARRGGALAVAEDRWALDAGTECQITGSTVYTERLTFAPVDRLQRRSLARSGRWRRPARRR
ncbi:hypothetical protein ACVIYL_004618 [Bradyrhizobium sp. USDA 3315]